MRSSEYGYRSLESMLGCAFSSNWFSSNLTGCRLFDSNVIHITEQSEINFNVKCSVCCLRLSMSSSLSSKLPSRAYSLPPARTHTHEMASSLSRNEFKMKTIILNVFSLCLVRHALHRPANFNSFHAPRRHDRVIYDVHWTQPTRAYRRQIEKELELEIEIKIKTQNKRKCVSDEKKTKNRQSENLQYQVQHLFIIREYIAERRSLLRVCVCLLPCISLLLSVSHWPDASVQRWEMGECHSYRCQSTSCQTFPLIPPYKYIYLSMFCFFFFLGSDDGGCHFFSCYFLLKKFCFIFGLVHLIVGAGGDRCWQQRRRHPIAGRMDQEGKVARIESEVTRPLEYVLCTHDRRRLHCHRLKARVSNRNMYAHTKESKR